MKFTDMKAKDDDEMLEVMSAVREEYPVEVTGDACVGDEVAFAEAKFTGSRRKPKFDHYEFVAGRIVKDSYGEKAQQHTFTIELEDGGRIRRMGRNVYRHGTYAKRRDPQERAAALAEKHARGEVARDAREACWRERFAS